MKLFCVVVMAVVASCTEGASSQAPVGFDNAGTQGAAARPVESKPEGPQGLHGHSTGELVREAGGRVGEQSRAFGVSALNGAAQLREVAREAVLVGHARLESVAVKAGELSRSLGKQMLGRSETLYACARGTSVGSCVVGGVSGQALNCCAPLPNGATPLASADGHTVAAEKVVRQRSWAAQKLCDLSMLPWWLMYVSARGAGRLLVWLGLWALWMVWNLVSWAVLAALVWALVCGVRAMCGVGPLGLLLAGRMVCRTAVEGLRVRFVPSNGGRCYQVLFKPEERARVVRQLGRLPNVGDVLALLSEQSYQLGIYGLELVGGVVHVQRVHGGRVWTLEMCVSVLEAVVRVTPEVRMGQVVHRGRFNKQHLGSMRRIASHLGMHGPCCAWTDSDYEWCDASEVPELRYGALVQPEHLEHAKIRLGFAPSAADVVSYFIDHAAHFARGVARLVMVEDGEVAAVRVGFGDGLPTRVKFFWALLTKFGWPREMLWFGEPLLASGLSAAQRAYVNCLSLGDDVVMFRPKPTMVEVEGLTRMLEPPDRKEEEAEDEKEKLDVADLGEGSATVNGVPLV